MAKKLNPLLRVLTAFTDTMLPLTPQENRQMMAEIEKMKPKERDAILSMTTCWKEEGLEQGRREGALVVIFHQLYSKFGEFELDEEEKTILYTLKLNQILSLSKAVLKLSDLNDFRLWLEKKSATKKSKIAQIY